ncbi:helix-turn-helix transcriptional regulator [Staphylococcus chromogenes]|uniref:helix-turn-helix transcriptional regulator n=1 Tax=Staphylococcus chromogenes TaxID=46126 RepID=UPI003AFFBFB4
MIVILKNDSLKKSMYLQGYSISKMASECNISLSYMSLIVNGKRTPSPKLAKKLSSILNMKVEDLFIFSGGDGSYDSTTVSK